VDYVLIVFDILPIHPEWAASYVISANGTLHDRGKLLSPKLIRFERISFKKSRQDSLGRVATHRVMFNTSELSAPCGVTMAIDKENGLSQNKDPRGYLPRVS
jgi:hypothetical protein